MSDFLGEMKIVSIFISGYAGMASSLYPYLKPYFSDGLS